jgi:serine protease
LSTQTDLALAIRSASGDDGAVRSAVLPIAASLLSLLPAQVFAEPVVGRTHTYEDAGRTVAVERVGAPRLDHKFRLLTDVRLTFDAQRSIDAAIDGSALVELGMDGDLEVEARGGRLVRELMPSLGIWLVEDATGGDGVDLAARLSAGDAKARGIVHAIPNLYLRTKTFADYTPDDPELGAQWFFGEMKLDMTQAWGLSRGDAGTRIVVIDTGCDLTHPDLAAKMGEGADVVDEDDDPTFEIANPGAAHGTECAGLVAAVTDNDEGIAGACPECGIHCVRMLSGDLLPISANVAAFQFALDVDAAVVSNSWGFAEPAPVPSMLASAITNVAQNGRGGLGAVVVFAAGNDDREIADDELQAVEGVVNVGAVNNFDESTPFTNFGSSLDIVAYTGTVTTDIAGPQGEDDGDYTHLFGGTSSACPVAAGVAALVVSAAPGKTGAEISQILIDTAKPAPYAVPDATGHDDLYGYGIIDPSHALKVALGLPTGEGGGSAEGGSTPAGGGSADGDAPGDDGCGCALAPRSGAPGLALMALAAMLLAHRRRRP